MLSLLPYTATEAVCRHLSVAELRALGEACVGGFFPQIVRETQIRRYSHNFFSFSVTPEREVEILAFRRLMTQTESIDLQHLCPLMIASKNTLLLSSHKYYAAKTHSERRSLELLAWIAQIPNLRVVVEDVEETENPVFHKLLATLRGALRLPALLIVQSRAPSTQLHGLLLDSMASSSLRQLKVNLATPGFQKQLFAFVTGGNWTTVHIKSELPYSFFESVLNFWNSPKSSTMLKPCHRTIMFNMIRTPNVERNTDYDIPHPSDPKFVMRVSTNYAADHDLRLISILVEIVNMESRACIDYAFFAESDSKLINDP
ncbi:hypothetical protein QR680_008528 [Steinernema hermaphroditum]|uniref:F-box domain-containing protein n=1 Tax=Steinernema hermaphroditum TaxID=289476 RepID=A0AA39M894_9BILA|nr:hypothetical protein QR680_008528 [Steinernema hermaphroditum]